MGNAPVASATHRATISLPRYACLLISMEDFLEFLPTLFNMSYENGMEGEPTFLDDKAVLGLGGMRDPGTSEADADRRLMLR